MKLFRKHDADLRNTFTDDSARIDPKFKAQLRAQVAAATKHGSHAPKHGARRWQKLLWVPVVAAALVAVLVGLNLGGSGKVTRPLEPSTVSAAELIRRSDEFKKKFDLDKYSFFYSTNTFQIGPKGNVCDGAYTFIGEPETSKYQTWSYRAKDNGIEAYYQLYQEPRGSAKTQIYNDTPERLLPDYYFPQSQSLSDELRMQSIGVEGQGNSYNFLVDATGKPLKTDEIAKTTQGGTSVYILYKKINPKMQSPLQCKTTGIAQPNPNKLGSFTYEMEDREDITKIVINAETYQTVSFENYVDTISEQNLISRSTYDLEYSNISATQALQEMTAAGFDKSTALRDVPGGRDGPPPLD